MFYNLGRNQEVSNEKSNYHGLKQRYLCFVIENPGIDSQELLCLLNSDSRTQALSAKSTFLNFL